MIDFLCKLTGNGWMEATLIDENNNAKIISASYLSDAPYDLIMALALICEGVNDTQCLWNNEPGGYQWVFSRLNNNLELKIIQSEHAFKNPSTDKDHIIFSGHENLGKFAHKVLREFNIIKTYYSTDGYENLWKHKFPLQALSRLSNGAKSLKVDIHS